MELRELQRRLQDVDQAHVTGVSNLRDVTMAHELEVTTWAMGEDWKDQGTDGISSNSTPLSSPNPALF